jgi:uncharacterized protein YuzE
MSNIKFGLSLSINENTGAVSAAYLQVREGNSAETRELSDGRALADYDENGQLVGIEFLASCEGTVVDHLADAEPEAVRRFIRGAIPRELVAS